MFYADIKIFVIYWSQFIYCSISSIKLFFFSYFFTFSNHLQFSDFIGLIEIEMIKKNPFTAKWLYPDGICSLFYQALVFWLIHFSWYERVTFTWTCNFSQLFISINISFIDLKKNDDGNFLLTCPLFYIYRSSP